MNRTRYPSDLTDREWTVLKPLLPHPKEGGRPQEHSYREIVNAIFYVDRAGCAWRMLPHDLPNWRTVGVSLSPSMAAGQHLGACAGRTPRKRACESRTPCSTECRHSRFTVSEDERKRGIRGYDGGKKVEGRKRHLLVDTQGLLLKVKVLSANLTDRDGGQLLLPQAKEAFPTLKHLFVDGGYKGKWAEWAHETLGWGIQVVQRPPKAHGVWWPEDEPLPQHYLDLFAEQKKFKVIPRRWVVERTFAWLSFQCRLNRDYDLLPETTESFIHVAMIRLMLRRLAC